METNHVVNGQAMLQIHMLTLNI